MNKPLGPVMLDVQGVELTSEDRELLCHPAVGGVILFTRNYQDREQLAALTADIAGLRTPRLVIGVDQEGGRVQRFRDGFSLLPPAGRFGELFADDPERVLRAAADLGWLMATELREVGVDFSFAPVLDVERGVSRVIGDRAFSHRLDEVADLACAWISGMHKAGMPACGKHFPGHGAVIADSHLESPVDPRPEAEIKDQDILPFRDAIAVGVDAIMPAHVIYSSVDPNPAGFSPFWLQHVLRRQMGFGGVIFSDDLNMAGAAVGGGYGDRAHAALSAGCDVAVICNNRVGAIEVVEVIGEPSGSGAITQMQARSIDHTGVSAHRVAAMSSLALLNDAA